MTPLEMHRAMRDGTFADRLMSETTLRVCADDRMEILYPTWFHDLVDPALRTRIHAAVVACATDAARQSNDDAARRR